MKIINCLFFIFVLYRTIAGSVFFPIQTMTIDVIDKRSDTQDLPSIRDAIDIIKRGLQFSDGHISEVGLPSFTELAKKYIRPAEEYEVITEDGYILKLFHIPGNANNIVLIGHGILSSSDDFLIRGNISLIYMLAEQGFDIWAMNFRGNRYSRRHIKLNPDIDKEFWDYSVHENGFYDYKAVIDFILGKTGQDKLSVIGHSAGTTAFLILLAERPQYNNKIKIFAGLAPVCYLRHTSPILKAIIKLKPILFPIAKAIGIGEVLGYYSRVKKIIDVICSQGIIGYNLCFKILVALFVGFNPVHIEQGFVSTILGHAPAGTNIKTLVHYTDIYRLNKFSQYDYGSKNLAIYGSLMPPIYDLKKLKANIALFAAKGDSVLGIEDAERLRMELPNVVHYQVVSDDTFKHIDYVWSRNAHTVLYPYIVDLLNRYTTNHYHEPLR